MKVLLDTSFLVSAMGGKIDVVLELSKFGKPEMYVIGPVIEELRRLSAGKGRDAANARLSMDFLERHGVATAESGKGSTDTMIAETAAREGMAVCTVDRGLRRRLAVKGVPVITIRQGKYLVRDARAWGTL